MAKNCYKQAEKIFSKSLGPSGRGFEPLHSDQISNAPTGGVAYFFAHLGSNPRALRNVPVARFNPRWPAPGRKSSPSTRTKSSLKSAISESFSYSLSIAAQGVRSLTNGARKAIQNIYIIRDQYTANNFLHRQLA